MNVTDEEGNITGLEMMLPGDPDTHILLTSNGFYDQSALGSRYQRFCPYNKHYG